MGMSGKGQNNERCSITYQIIESYEAGFLKGRESPIGNEVSVKVMEESKKPSSHDFVI